MSGSLPPVTTQSDTHRRRRRRRRWPFVVLALVIVSAFGGAWRLRKQSGTKIDPALVVSSKRGDLSVEVVDVGRIEAIDKVEIASRIPGRVSTVTVDEGDSVKPGQVLIQLDRRESLRQAARARAELSRALAKSAHAEREVKRKERGVSEGIVAVVDLQAAEQERALAKVEVELAKVAVAEAHDRSKDTRLTAPIAGTVTRRAIEPGEMVKPGVESSFESVALLTICDLSRLVVKIDLNQIDVAKVKLGQKVKLALDALPGESFSARVTRIAPASVKVAGKDLETFPVEAELDRADPRIKPGMTADARIFVQTQREVVLLPLESVRRDGDKAVVTRVVTAGTSERTEVVPVTLGAENDHEIEIVSGLSEGERVKIDPPSARANETKI